MDKEIIGDDYPTYEQVVNEYHESKKSKEEGNHLCGLFSYECTLNNVIHEFGGYAPTKEIAIKMQKLSSTVFFFQKLLLSYQKPIKRIKNNCPSE